MFQIKARGTFFCIHPPGVGNSFCKLSKVPSNISVDSFMSCASWYGFADAEHEPVGIISAKFSLGSSCLPKGKT